MELHASPMREKAVIFIILSPSIFFPKIYETIAEIIAKIEEQALTSKNLKDILVDVLEKTDTITDIIKNLGIENISDNETLRKIVQQVIKDNPDTVQDYKSGHDRAMKFFMGQVMKQTKGKANPKIATDLLIEELK